MDKFDYSRITPGINALTKSSSVIPISTLSFIRNMMLSAACAISTAAVSLPG